MYSSNWFYNLTRPPLSPPDWVFLPIWIFLYVAIFISVILFTFTKKDISKKRGYIYFIAQIILNFLWSPIFFIYKNIALAFFVVILMDIFVYFTIKGFYTVNKVSAFLLIPYFLWILYATYLNLGYLFLN